MKSICICLVALLILIKPGEIEALQHAWVEVPESQYGKQLWDKNSVQYKKDGSLRIFSRFIPKSSSEITEDILYTMDINCLKKSYRDIAIGGKELNEYKNENLDWLNPNGDKLIIEVINQVCNFAESKIIEHTNQ